MLQEIIKRLEETKDGVYSINGVTITVDRVRFETTIDSQIHRITHKLNVNYGNRQEDKEYLVAIVDYNLDGAPLKRYFVGYGDVDKQVFYHFDSDESIEAYKAAMVVQSLLMTPEELERVNTTNIKHLDDVDSVSIIYNGLYEFSFEHTKEESINFNIEPMGELEGYIKVKDLTTETQSVTTYEVYHSSTSPVYIEILEDMSMQIVTEDSTLTLLNTAVNLMVTKINNVLF